MAVPGRLGAGTGFGLALGGAIFACPANHRHGDIGCAIEPLPKGEDSVLAQLAAMGVATANVTLHVGAGTFQPVKTENIAEHTMHSEWYDIPVSTQEALHACRQRGGKVWAVGTTSVRTLESWAQTGQAQGDTEIFITPGFEFKWVDRLITNFHLPKSTLMMLVSALAGYEHVMRLYAHAISKQYRFFSYGDAMLLKRA